MNASLNFKIILSIAIKSCSVKIILLLKENDTDSKACHVVFRFFFFDQSWPYNFTSKSNMRRKRSIY